MDWELWLVLFTMALSFFFSASETAITSLGRLETQTMMAAGGRTARLVSDWVKNPNRYLTTVLVGNNISNTAASSVMTLWLRERYATSIPVAMSVFTLIFIVLAEITPKILARHFAQVLARNALEFLRLIWLLLWPVNVLIGLMTSFVNLIIGSGHGGLQKPISEEELGQTIEIAAKEGGIDQATGEVLSNLIDFSDRIARDIMTPRTKIQAIPIQWGQDQVLRFVAADGHSRYPVIRGSLDEIVGVLLVKDLLAHLQRSSPGSWTRVVRRPYFISEVVRLGNVLKEMKRAGTHLALVRNETGVLTGLVSLEDVLEEVFGQIRDEHDDPSEGGFGAAIGGPQILGGDMPLIDFNERFGASLPLGGHYSTLNGYLLSRMGGQLPPVGTIVFAEDATFRIQSVSESGIATLELLEQLREQDRADDE